MQFTGKNRKEVKLRVASDGSGYHNLGSLTVKQFLAQACQWDNDLPADISEESIQDGFSDTTVTGIENNRVTVTGYLLAVKRAPDEDDFHVEIGGKKSWNTPHMIIEVSPTSETCDVREKLVDFVNTDIQAGGENKSGKHIFKYPPEVEVMGFAFVDMFHGRGSEEQFCIINGGRGMLKKKGDRSKVQRGLYEIHPVLELKGVQ